MRTIQEARVVDTLKPVIRVNRTQITSQGAVANMAGPAGNNAPLTSITYTMTNTSGGPLTYVLGDPQGLVAGAANAVWTQPTGVRSGSVAGVQGSYSSCPVSVMGINYIVSNALQFDNAFMYHSADRDGRYSRQPIDITAQLRNNQYIATRQTLRFDADYLLDDLHAFTVLVPDTYQVTISLLTGGNMA